MHSIKIFPQHIMLRTALFLLLTSGYFTACKKKDTIANNNQFKATIIRTNGSPVEINAVNTNAEMGCSSFPGGTYVIGTADAGQIVDITLFINGNFKCISAPATFPGKDFWCTYLTSKYGDRYENLGGRSIGSITFTKISNTEMEGYFNTVCRRDTDSVIVSGTFKGDFLGH